MWPILEQVAGWKMYLYMHMWLCNQPHLRHSSESIQIQALLGTWCPSSSDFCYNFSLMAVPCISLTWSFSQVQKPKRWKKTTVLEVILRLERRPYSQQSLHSWLRCLWLVTGKYIWAIYAKLKCWIRHQIGRGSTKTGSQRNTMWALALIVSPEGRWEGWWW